MPTLETQIHVENIKTCRQLWVITIDESIMLFREYVKNSAILITKNLEKWQQ